MPQFEVTKPCRVKMRTTTSMMMEATLCKQAKRGKQLRRLTVASILQTIQSGAPFDVTRDVGEKKENITPEINMGEESVGDEAVIA